MQGIIFMPFKCLHRLMQPSISEDEKWPPLEVLSQFVPFLSTLRNLVDLNSKLPEIIQSKKKNENFIAENFLQITGVRWQPCCQYFSSFLTKMFWSLPVSNVAVFSTTDIVLTFFMFFFTMLFPFRYEKGCVII